MSFLRRQYDSDGDDARLDVQAASLPPVTIDGVTAQRIADALSRYDAHLKHECGSKQFRVRQAASRERIAVGDIWAKLSAAIGAARSGGLDNSAPGSAPGGRLPAGESPGAIKNLSAGGERTEAAGAHEGTPPVASDAADAKHCEVQHGH